jgi:hypothetical protein
MALVGILWAEIGVRLFAKVPPLLVGIVCCTAGSACIALSKYYDGIARLIDSTPERTLKVLITPQPFPSASFERIPHDSFLRAKGNRGGRRE